MHSERTGYPTQKPEALLERILKASSNPTDLVFDPFCGSGTTAAVASRLGRNWIASDVSPLAIQTSYRRLLLAAQTAPFTLWQADDGTQRSALRPSISVNASGLVATVKLEGASGAAEIPAGFPDNIVLWEIDWNFDGRVFQSQSQAVRQWKGNHIDLELCQEFAKPGSRMIAVRAVDAAGNSGFDSVPVQLTP
jgi:hypothetical protein